MRPEPWRVGLALLTGGFLGLAILNPHMPALAWIALVPLIIALHQAHFALGLRLSLMAWLLPSILVPLVPNATQVFGLSLLNGLVFALANILWRRLPTDAGFWLFPALGLVDLALVQLLGLGRTGLLASSQANLEPLFLSTRLIGVSGLTTLLYLANFAWAWPFLQPRPWRRAMLPPGVSTLILVALAVYGTQVSQGLAKGDAVMVAALVSHDQSYEPLIREAVAEGALLLVFPQARVAPEEVGPFLEAACQRSLEVGVWQVQTFANEYGDRAVVINPRGEILGEDTQADGPFVVSMGSIRLGVVFGSDLMNPTLGEQLWKSSAQIIALPTGESRPREEVMIKFLAVESGASLIKATSQGTSLLLDHRGRIIGQASSEEGPRVLTGALIPGNPPVGVWIAPLIQWSILLGAAVGLGMHWVRSVSEGGKGDGDLR